MGTYSMFGMPRLMLLSFIFQIALSPSAIRSGKVIYTLEPEETKAPILPTITACKGTAFFRITQHYIPL